MPTPWQERLFSTSRGWLSESLCIEDIGSIIPADDPVRLWWDDNPASAIEALLEVVSGAGDVLTWLALMESARSRGQLPTGMAQLFAEALSAAARSGRAASYTVPYQAFLSYSHRDMERAAALLDILAEQDVQVFQDVRDIRAGESIVGRLHSALTTAPRAIVLVTANYAESVWTQKELSLLRDRHMNGELTLLPVLLDDVPLPALIADTFTIDLRGFRGLEDRAWAADRLIKLADACRPR